MRDPHNPRAFPSNAIDDSFGGMTLADHYAGQALVGILSAIPAEHQKPDKIQPVVDAAWNFSDAMLAERAKRVCQVSESQDGALPNGLVTGSDNMTIGLELMPNDRCNFAHGPTGMAVLATGWSADEVLDFRNSTGRLPTAIDAMNGKPAQDAARERQDHMRGIGLGRIGLG